MPILDLQMEGTGVPVVRKETKGPKAKLDKRAKPAGLSAVHTIAGCARAGDQEVAPYDFSWGRIPDGD